MSRSSRCIRHLPERARNESFDLRTLRAALSSVEPAETVGTQVVTHPELDGVFFDGWRGTTGSEWCGACSEM